LVDEQKLNAKMEEDNINRYDELINMQKNYDNTGGGIGDGNDTIEEYKNIAGEDNDKNLKIVTII
jgi:hypothetical protein